MVPPRVIPLDQAAVAIPNAVDGHIAAKFTVERLGHAAQCRIQALAVAAAGEHTDFHIEILLFIRYFLNNHTTFRGGCEEVYQKKTPI